MVALLLFVASCDFLEIDCPGDVKISVETGPTPRFDWSPDCEVTALYVKEEETGKSTWVIEGTSSPFKPPVTYGSLPKAAKTVTAPLPLETDRKYVVGVFGARPYGVKTEGKGEFFGG